MNKKKAAITLGIMVLVLTVLVIVQYKTIESANSLLGSGNSELKTEVLKWKEKYEDSYGKLQVAEKVLEEKRQASTKDNDKSTKAEKELKKVNSLIGAIDVTGEGVIVTVQDNPNATNGSIGALENISDYLIHDRDLIILVNELKNAGAEAISINDERIINTSAITCDGNVILVNGNKISSPFIIKVIGSPETIIGGIQRPGGKIEELEEYGLVASVKKQSKITIYKYNGILDYKYLRSE